MKNLAEGHQQPSGLQFSDVKKVLGLFQWIWKLDRMKLLGYGPQNKVREHLTNWSSLSVNLSYCQTEEEPISSRSSRSPQLKSYSSSSRFLHRVVWKEVEYRSIYKDTNKRCNSNVLYRLDGDRLVGMCSTVYQVTRVGCCDVIAIT